MPSSWQFAHLQNIDALENQDVGPVDLDIFVGDDVVGQVGIARSPHIRLAGLDLRQEAQQRPDVVAFGKALLVHQIFAPQIGVGMQETVGCHQVDLGTAGPTGQQLFQHPGRG